jgi:cell division protein FtsB
VQEWIDFVQKIALLISSVVGLLTIFNTLKQTDYSNAKEKKEELKEDVELYRKRWLQAEEAYDKLLKDNERLKRKLNKLESGKDNE